MTKTTTINFKESFMFTIDNLIKRGYVTNHSVFIREAIQEYIEDIKKWEAIEKCLGFQ